MKTIEVQGSDEIMVSFGEMGTFIRGKRIDLIVTGKSSDSDIPQIVKDCLVGLRLDAVLTRDQVVEQCGESLAECLPKNCLLAYAKEVINILASKGYYDAAIALKNIASSELDIYVLEEGTFMVV